MRAPKLAKLLKLSAKWTASVWAATSICSVRPGWPALRPREGGRPGAPFAPTSDRGVLGFEGSWDGPSSCGVPGFIGELEGAPNAVPSAGGCGGVLGRRQDGAPDG